MGRSILNTVKKMLGVDPTYNYFDLDIMVHINSVFAILKQLGVKAKCYTIEDSSVTWEDIFGENKDLETIKSYVFARVKMLFDPPSSSSVMESLKEVIKEFEWRINVSVDPGDVE